MSKIKEIVQNRIHLSNLKKYNEILEKQKNSYLTYIENWEAFLGNRYKRDESIEKQFYKICIEECKGKISFSDISVPYVLFYSKKGDIDYKTYAAYHEFFLNHSDVVIAYSHEDENKKNPWFKPEFSPNTLFSYFYFGNMFAARTECLKKTDWLASDNPYINIYDMALKLTDSSKAGLVDFVLYHQNENLRLTGYDANYNEIKEAAFSRRGIDAHIDIDSYGIGHILKNVYSNKDFISIIIPSKDHPDVLERCIKSVREKSTFEFYEIIVIDNGSNVNNKALYEALGMKYSFSYYYEEMEFNFSKMCNMGYRHAKGKYCLLLNDDMEIKTPDWMERLLSSASICGNGCVGAKLLYPNSSIIQHAGITNMYGGPAHKLQGDDDSEYYYYGHNRFDYDMIGVTAACLLVSKKIYENVGLFNEDLKVAYNDVDFCFKVDHQGLYNVIRNDVILYHHESLSRGNDNLDEAKKKRLYNERIVLFDSNPGYYDYDPFYSKHLTGVSTKYACCLPYENRNVLPVSNVKRISGDFLKMHYNETLIIGMDYLEKERYALQGGEKCYLIDLHAHVRNLDSADYSYKMYIKSEDNCFVIPCIRRYRPDVERVLNNQQNVAMSGFVARIPESMIPQGKYEIWMEAKCTYSRQTLCNKAGGILEIK